MPFVRPLRSRASEHDPNLQWPIDGLAYLVLFMGPLSAGPIAGVLFGDWRAILIGLFGGIGITFLEVWLTAKLLEPLVAKYQNSLEKGMPKILANVAAFAWAIALTALSMMVPVLVLGKSLTMGTH